MLQRSDKAADSRQGVLWIRSESRSLAARIASRSTMVISKRDNIAAYPFGWRTIRVGFGRVDRIRTKGDPP